MNINFLGREKHRFLKPELLKNRVLAIFFVSVGLIGCGSDDKLPGGANPGDNDPLASGTPLFMVQRAIETDMGGIVADELSDPTRYRGNGRLIMKSQANQNAPEVIISNRVLSGNYDVRDLDVSHDGRYVLFSARAEETDPDNPTTWNIYEYDTEEETVGLVMPGTLGPDEGHDIMARYLGGAEGNIVFSSTRQQTTSAVIADEGASYVAQDEDRQGPVLNLHVMNRAGQSIQQITFNMSHDIYPTVAPDGNIIYVRWDNYSRNQFSLYKTSPFGENTELLYGHHSHDTGNNNSEFQFIKPSFLPSGELFVMARPSNSTRYGGDFITIDVDNYIDNTQPTNTTNGSGPAQNSITETTVETDHDLSPGGYYGAYFPLWDGTSRALVSWSQCRVDTGDTIGPCTDDNLNTPGATAATPAYGVWMQDYGANTQNLVLLAESGFVYTDIALAARRDSPAVISGRTYSSKLSESLVTDLLNSNTAILHIRSVYDLDGEIDLDFDGNTTEHNASDYANLSNPTITSPSNRAARYLKIIRGVPLPSRDDRNPANGSFGRSTAQGMRKIVGYVPIEPDGSVKARVPANTPITISITDAMGKRISSRHQNWITLRPGELLECNGCHQRNSELPHGRPGAQADSINAGMLFGNPYPGADPATTAPFDSATMAEAKVDASSGNESLMTPNKDLYFSDIWTPAPGATPEDFYPLRYDDIDAITTANPSISSRCDPWQDRCRVTIHYEDHIQPLWDYARLQTASDTLPATCTRCHSRADGMGSPQIPAGQLELTAEVDGTNGILNRSYVELFFNDIEIVDDGMGGIADCTVEVQRVDENGDPVLDDMGQPIFDTVLCPANITPSMSTNGALASRFFDAFEAGNGLSEDHTDFLTPDELKLIAEWLDIGAQYYNDPYEAPEN